VLQQQKATMNEPKMPEQFVAEQVASALNMPVISRLRFAGMIGVSEGLHPDLHRREIYAH
jgi:hypothetical protein